MSNDNWDRFDWNALGADDDVPAADGHARRNGMLAGETDEDERQPAGEGRWVAAGGVLQWEEADDTPQRADLRAEARSPWATEDVDLPLGAPHRMRVRAVRAWLVRRRLLADAAQGEVLLERRQHEEREEAESSGVRAEGGDTPQSGDALEIALAEHQAAAAEFETLLEALADLEQHAGEARVLVEFYLWLTERLAALAVAPEAPENFAPGILLAEVERVPAAARPSARARAEWSGRVEAVLATRRRVERVSAPEPED